MSKDGFALATFLLVLVLGIVCIKLYVNQRELRREVEFIKKNYTPLNISRQRAAFVDLSIEELGCGVMSASSLAKTALTAVMPDSEIKDTWYVGLTTTEIDSIRTNCEPTNYYKVAKRLKKSKYR